jgi:hypothetical protein
MDFLELLKSLSLSENQICAIKKGMSKNRVFITYEEKIEERFQKMKHQRDIMKSKLDLTEKALEDQAKNSEINEDIQRIRKVFEDKINTLKSSYEDKIKDMAIDIAIHKKLVNVKYPELLICKFDKSKFSIDADGTVLGFEDQFFEIKKAYIDLFTDENEITNNSVSKDFPKEGKPESTYLNLIVQTDIPIKILP